MTTFFFNFKNLIFSLSLWGGVQHLPPPKSLTAPRTRLMFDLIESSHLLLGLPNGTFRHFIGNHARTLNSYIRATCTAHSSFLDFTPYPLLMTELFYMSTFIIVFVKNPKGVQCPYL